jgi:hypothetical protein
MDIQSIFGVLENYHDIVKYFGFRVPRSVWGATNFMLLNTIVLLKL